MQTFNDDNREERTHKVKEGISFILSHFDGRQQLFPRKISTGFSNGKQFMVYDTEQILNECIKSNFIDCRIQAYPVLEYENSAGTLNIQAPNLMFIDIDLPKDLVTTGEQESRVYLAKVLRRSLVVIENKLNNCKPTILWTGNGYHIYLVLDTRPLELIDELKELSPKPSEEFLKFAGGTFSNNKKDSCHNPTFRSSPLSIPLEDIVYLTS